jgi:hypothetical protein
VEKKKEGGKKRILGLNEAWLFCKT